MKLKVRIGQNLSRDNHERGDFLVKIEVELRTFLNLVEWENERRNEDCEKKRKLKVALAQLERALSENSEINRESDVKIT